MPYTKKRYGTQTQFKKYRRCVAKVEKKLGRGKPKVNPYAVCRASIYGKKK